jgi:hypothetical protein
MKKPKFKKHFFIFADLNLSQNVTVTKNDILFLLFIFTIPKFSNFLSRLAPELAEPVVEEFVPLGQWRTQQ